MLTPKITVSWLSKASFRSLNPQDSFVQPGYQAGLNFAISYKKNTDFLGKDALLKIKDKKPDKKMTMLTLKSKKAGEPLLLHDEPIYLDDKIIGRTTSGNYSFNLARSISNIR